MGYFNEKGSWLHRALPIQLPQGAHHLLTLCDKNTRLAESQGLIREDTTVYYSTDCCYGWLSSVLWQG